MSEKTNDNIEDILRNPTKYVLNKYDIMNKLSGTSDIELIKKIISNPEQYGLQQLYGLTKADIISGTKNPSLIKNILLSSEELNLSPMDIDGILINMKIENRNLVVQTITEVIKSSNSLPLIDNLIKSAKNSCYLENYEIKAILLNIDNKTIIEYIINNAKEYGFESHDISKLVTNLGDIDLIKKVLNNLDKYELTNYDIADIISSTQDIDFIKKVLNDPDKYKLSPFNISQIVASTKDIELMGTVISNSKIYGLDSFLIKELLNGLEHIENINNIKDISTVENLMKIAKDNGMMPDQIVSLSKKIGIKELTEHIIHNAESYELCNLAIAELAQSIGNTKIIENLIKNTDFPSPHYVATMISLIDDPNRLKYLIQNPQEYNLSSDVFTEYRTNYADLDFIRENINHFFSTEHIDSSKLDLLLHMYTKNNDILKTNFNILEDKFIETLGEDTINQISCYPDTVNTILKLNTSQLKTLGKCLNSFIENTQSYDWTPLASRILNNINSYQELIEELSNTTTTVDIEKITSIIIHPNTFEIKTLNDITNYEQIKQKKCESLINSDNIESKVEATLQKIFNISTNEAKIEIEKFLQDIDSITDENLKSYIQSLNAIVNLKQPEVLEQLFYNVEKVKSNNPIFIERMLKNEYCKMYMRDLFDIKNATKIDGKTNMYNAGANFKMIITSVAPYVHNQPDNYYNDWNRPSIGSQHFCTSYIRNDMMGHAKIPHICYGFSQMSDDSLVLSGSKDIYSSGAEFTSTAQHDERYYSPDTQINETETYNEMDFKRIQDGKKKQPDYIVVFQKDGKIDNLEKAQKASKDFGGLPIVVIDVNKCLESEQEKVNDLITKYEESESPEIARQLYQKVRNNRVTDKNFCSDLSLESIKEIADLAEESSKLVSEEDLSTIYQEIDAPERQEENKLIKNIYMQINTIIKEETNYEK